MPVDGIYDYNRKPMTPKERKEWNDWWSRLRNPKDKTSPFYKKPSTV